MVPRNNSRSGQVLPTASRVGIVPWLSGQLQLPVEWALFRDDQTKVSPTSITLRLLSSALLTPFHAPPFLLSSSPLDLWDQDPLHSGHLSAYFKPSFFFFLQVSDLHRHFGATSATYLSSQRQSLDESTILSKPHNKLLPGIYLAAIRQCATWSSTLITHNFPERRKPRKQKKGTHASSSLMCSR